MYSQVVSICAISCIWKLGLTSTLPYSLAYIHLYTYAGLYNNNIYIYVHIYIYTYIHIYIYTYIHIYIYMKDSGTRGSQGGNVPYAISSSSSSGTIPNKNHLGWNETMLPHFSWTCHHSNNQIHYLFIETATSPLSCPTQYGIDWI